jgi:UDP-N-acetylmuramoyl-tripeptide--D-alanyl-D-alanine ligase
VTQGEKACAGAVVSGPVAPVWETMDYLRILGRSVAQLGDMRPGLILGWARSEAIKAARVVATPIFMRQAARHRDRFAPRFVAVAGSCGKSTTTMVTHRLFAAQASAALGLHSNTLRGTRDSLRRLRAPVDYLVQEVSEAPPGTIAAITRLIRPHGAVITSVGLDHQTMFQTREKVAAELSGLARAMNAEGVLCVREDEPLARALAAQSAARTLLFGTGPGADLRAVNVDSRWPGRLRFTLLVDGRSLDVRTRFVGTLMLSNVLGALALVHGLGLDLEQAVADLAGIEPLPDRLGIVERAGDHTYILDGYKAPFWSTEEVARDLPNLATGRLIFVLGDMSDLGPNSGSKYRRVLRVASDHAELVVGMGQAAHNATRLRQTDPHRTNITAVRDMAELAELLDRQAPGVVVVKGNGLDATALLNRKARAREMA